MIIQTLRLKNIKAFGDGPTGQGHLLTLQPGLNLILGRNGSGKTTLIESIGLCLFGADPREGQKLSLERYFLRDSEREGEIEMTFSIHNSAYRLIRFIGSRQRRSKLLDAANHLIAEGEEAIGYTLAKIFHVPNYKRLKILFDKLIGVGQGKLTLAFELKPSEQQAYFNPLFDVERFSKMSEKLAPAIQALKEKLNAAFIQIELLKGKIEPLQSAIEMFQLAIAEKLRVENALFSLEQKSIQLKKQLTALKQAELSFQQAKEDKEKAHSMSLQRAEALKQAQADVERALHAHQLCQQSFLGKESYVKRAATIQDMEKELLKRQEISQKKEKALCQLLALKQQLATFQERQSSLKQQSQSAEEELCHLKQVIGQLKIELEETQEKESDLAKKSEPLHVFLKEKRSLQQKALALYQHLLEELQTEPQEEKTSFNEADLKAALQEEKELEKQLTETLTQKETFARQLIQIQGGMCPFLKQSCRQFDKASVSAQELTLEKQANSIQSQLESARQRLQKLQEMKQIHERQSLAIESKRRDIQQLFQRLNSLLSLNDFDDEKKATEAIAEALKGLQEQIEAKESLASCLLAEQLQLKEKISLAKGAQKLHRQQENSLSLKLASWQREESALLQSLTASAAAIAALEKKTALFSEQLLAYQDTEDKLVDLRRQQKRDRHDFETYLKNEEESLKLASQKQILQQADDDCRGQMQILKEKEALLIARQNQLNREELECIERELLNLSAKAGAQRELLLHVQQKVSQYRQQRLTVADLNRQLELAQKERRRFKAALQLTETYKKIFKNAAPQIASLLAETIAAKAEEIYNAISAEAIKIRWDALHYNLKVQTMSGEKVFKMLSGGEQTKLALAMTMAMIAHFSHLQICLFDEPTYGIDSESRQSLVEQVKKLQREANFEQLILVSHDSLFDQEISHAIHLQKQQASGSLIAS